MSGQLRPNPIEATIPFDTDGVHHGFLRLPYSRDESAWGSIQIPITVVRNGAGSTALLTGANHGDEYEGPIALLNLVQELVLEEVSGCIIVVPFMNFPAFQAGQRTSPLDGVNLNRCFPGKPDGSPTEKIADYFQRTLIPLADVVLDFHSGGKSLEFVPFAAAHVLDDATQQAACVAAMQAFNAPYSMTLREIDATGMYDTAVEDSGKVFVSTELGGGGTTSALTVGIAKRGVRNLLRHAGILSGPVDIQPTANIDTIEGNCFCFGEEEGLLEFLVDLGEPVKQGQDLALIWSAKRSGRAPLRVASPNSGILAARHFPGLVKMGDCLAVVANVLR